MDVRAAAELCHGSLRIMCQGAAPWTKLDIMAMIGRPVAQPQIGQPDTDNFAKHLADFRSGDEIAIFAKGVLAGIIMGIGDRHIVAERDRAFAVDPIRDYMRCSGVIRLDAVRQRFSLPPPVRRARVFSSQSVPARRPAGSSAP